MNVALLLKLIDNLAGQIVGVVLFNGSPSHESETVLNLVSTSLPSARWLEEVEGKMNSTAAARALLVRSTLAWITGIILLIATLMGVRLDMNKVLFYLLVLWKLV